jgi:uncharacterized protein YktB (UPF0637 family)
MMVQKLDKKTVNGIIVEGDESLPSTIVERQQFIQLLTEIAKRLIQEKKSELFIGCSRQCLPVLC